MDLKKKTKRDLLLINVIIILVAMLFSCLFFFIYMDKKENESAIPVERVVELGIKVMIYPPNIIDYYNEIISDDKVTLSEESRLLGLIKDYEDTISDSLSFNAETATELQKAVKQLEAYDDVGFYIVPERLRAEVRQKLVDEVDLQKKQSK